MLVAKQAIVNASKELVGYELFCREYSHLRHNSSFNLYATTRLLYHLFMNVDLHYELRGKKAFINADEEVLFSRVLELLNPEVFVIELVETTVVTKALVKEVAKLKQKGFEFALDDFTCSHEEYERVKPLLTFISYIKLDTPFMRVPNCLDNVLAQKVIIAEKVESKEVFEAYKHLGVELFQGYFFANPQEVPLKSFYTFSQNTLVSLFHFLSFPKEAKHFILLFKKNPCVSKAYIRTCYSGSFFNYKYCINNEKLFTNTNLDAIALWIRLCLHAHAVEL